MKQLAWGLALLAALSACDSAQAENIHEHLHRVVAASNVHTLRVENVSGTITVKSGGRSVVIDAVKSAASEDALSRTHADIETNGDTVSVITRYDEGGSWFSFGRNGGSVDYTITVPAGVALKLSNVSGSIRLTAPSANVDASAVSGSIHADLGRVNGNRRVALHAVSGAIEASISRGSDVRISSSAISGSISLLSNGDNHDIRLGSGSASMNLSTVSGDITVSQQ
jgi:hypothetical protein